MPLKITDACINSRACIPVCPHKAIYMAGEPWSLAEGTSLPDNQPHQAHSGAISYIVPDKCNECAGFFDTPQCMEVCPTGAIALDPDFSESNEQLIAKGILLQGR